MKSNLKKTTRSSTKSSKSTRKPIKTIKRTLTNKPSRSFSKSFSIATALHYHTLKTTSSTSFLASTRQSSIRFMSVKLSKFNADEIQSNLNSVPLWKKSSGDRDAIERNFQFKDFNEAFSFMTRTALAAEQMCHHPEWFNVYNQVNVTLSTHDVSGLSTNDFQLAQTMDKFAQDYKSL